MVRVIDADTHVDETEATWEFIRDNELALKPQPDAPAVLDPTRRPVRYWLIDGHRQPRLHRDDQRTHTTVETRELIDTALRLQHMDELGTEVQVIYPTMFLVGVTADQATDVAIKRSYNRWLADRTQSTGGRLRWVSLLPATDISAAIEELRFAKANGACGVMKKGDQEAGHWVAEEYFYPIYEECQRLDLPVCFHIGAGTPDHSPMREFEHARFVRQGLAPINAFNSLVKFGIPAKFPGVRWGFIEVGSTWIPYLVHDIMRGQRRDQERSGTEPQVLYNDPTDVMRLNNFFSTCYVDEDLGYVLKYTGEDRLLMGSDYTHADNAQEFEFPKLLQGRADQGDIPQSAVEKILYDNPKTFYGL